jgi:hypothetical protein
MIKYFIVLTCSILFSVAAIAKNDMWQHSRLQLSEEQRTNLYKLETAAEIVEGKLKAKLDGDWRTFMNAKTLIAEKKEKMIADILTEVQYQTYLETKESLKKKKR